MSRVFCSSGLPKPITKLFKGASTQSTNSRKNCISLCFTKSDKKTFNIPHPPKDPPENYSPASVEHEALDVPAFIPAAIFRPFMSKCEKLGPGAGKNECYKNPEYYSYHRYSFVVLQLLCLKLREQREKENVIRCLYDKEDSDDDEIYSSDEEKK